MSKKNQNVLEVFAESLKLYFSNFDKFIQYMTFPVLGQIAGLGLVFLLTYFYAKNMPILMQKIPALNDFSILFIIAILITLPGLVIFVKAFWEYLVAYGAINSMLENMLRSGKVYDFDAHTELIKRRTAPFVGLWLLFGVFSLIALIPFFWVPCAVFAIYFVLVFQVFTYEPELSPVGCVRKSLLLVKGNFLKTFVLFALVGVLTYSLVPQIVNLFCEYTRLTLLFKNLFIPFINELPIADLNAVLSKMYIQPLKAEDIALFTVSTFVAQIVIQYTLPLRSILWGLWYRKLEGSLPRQVEKKKKTSKRPSEKLMEASAKKYSSKKIDRNILKRAMEKDDEE